MVDLIDASLSFDVLTVPVPDVSLGEPQSILDDVGGLDIPPIPTLDVSVGSRPLFLPVIDVPTVQVDVRPDRVELPSLPPFVYVTDVDVGIDVQYVRLDVPLTDFDQTVPVSVDLEGPTVETDITSSRPIGTITVPDVSVRPDTASVVLGSIQVPDVSVTPGEIPTPDLPPLPLSDLKVPTVDLTVDDVAIPDPRTLRVEAGLRLDEVRREILSPLPDGLVSDPAGFALEAVLAEAGRRVGDGLVSRLRALLAALVDASLDQDTRERLRARAEE
jgi:hypothetical protein